MAANPDLGTAPHRPAWRNQLASFWRWWTGELAAAMPERLSALRGGSRLPQVAFENGELVLVEPRSAVGPETRVAFQTLDATRASAAARALLERAGERRARARLLLGRQDALVRRVTMPAATEENLRQVLGFEMDRLTPFRADDVYFDYRVVGRDAAAATLAVQIAVARRDAVDGQLAALQTLGVSVQGVNVRDDLATTGAPLDLLPSERRGEKESSRERVIRYVLLGVVLALFASVLVWPLWRKREAVIALHPQVTRATQEAQATDTLAKELEKQVGDYNFLLGRKHGNLPALAFVEDVSRLLPDTTWVQQFDYKLAGKVREVQITGETPSSSKLIELLEQSQLLRNAQTRGTVTRGSLPGTERFMIAAEVRPRTTPEPRPVLEGLPDAGKAPAAPPKAAPVPAPVPPAPAMPTAPVAPPQGAAPAAVPPATQPAAPAKVQPAAPAKAPDPKAPPPKAAPGK